VGSFYDLNNPARLLAQATSGLQVLAAPGGPTFTGAEYYDYNGPAADWNFLHTGSGSDHFFIFKNLSTGTPQILFATKNASTTGVGYEQHCESAAGNSLVYVGNGAGFAIASSVAAQFASGSWGYQHITTIDGGSPEFVHRKGGSTIASIASVTFPSSDASAVFRLGASPLGTLFGAQMQFAELICCPILSASQISVVRQYIQITYGVAP
jgi:hypothetical protein